MTAANTLADISIPTAQQIWAAQDDLPTLCADRLLVTGEIFTPNAYYGMDFVYKSYARLPPDRPLKCVLPHGIEYNEDYLWDAEAAAPVPAVIHYSARQGRTYTQRTDKVALHGASPFLYVGDLLREPAPQRRAGTLFFLSHSTTWVTAVSQFDSLAEQLAALPEKFHPITLCIYWRDFVLGHHLEFVRRGMRVVSAGHIYDPHFLFRLYHLCSMHHYACSNELGSHVFYSMSAGCSYFHLGRRAEYQAADARSQGDISLPPSAVVARFETLFAEPLERSTPEQVALVREYVGADQKLTPDELRECLEFCERLDRFGVASWRSRRHWTYPRLAQRWLWQHPIRAARRVARGVLQPVLAKSAKQP